MKNTSSDPEIREASNTQPDEQACHGRRNVRSLYDEARKEGRVNVPTHVRENRRRRRELDLMQLET